MDITPLAITVTATGANKVYNGTTADPGVTFSAGVITGDVVNFADASATFASKNVGTGIAVAVSGITASGTDAGNYTLLNTTASTTANITPKPITVTATGSNIVYNTGVNDSVTLSSAGIVSGDTVTFADTSATFAGPNVGSGITVTVSGITDGGASAGNYSLSNTTATTTANITPAPLTVSGTTAAGKVYNGTTAAALSGATLVGVLGSDVVTLGNDAIGTFATKNVGSNIAVTTAMTIGGASAGNYSLTQPTGITATITPYVLSLTGTRAYNGTASAAANLFGTAGVLTGVGSETLTLSGTGTLSSKNVNAAQSFASLSGFTLTGIGSTLASDYTLTGGTDFVDITPATLTVSGTTAASRVYNGSTTASLSGATLVGVFGSDVVTLGNDTTGTFATANAGNGIAVTTAMTIGGTGASNYTLTQPTGSDGEHHALCAEPHRHTGIRRRHRRGGEPLRHRRRAHRDQRRDADVVRHRHAEQQGRERRADLRLALGLHAHRQRQCAGEQLHPGRRHRLRGHHPGEPHRDGHGGGEQGLRWHHDGGLERGEPGRRSRQRCGHAGH